MNLLFICAPSATLVFTSLTTTGGVGGAFILVPIFYWLGLPMYEAEALGLLMAFFSASTACVNYHWGGHIRYKIAAALIASMLIFSPLGSYVSAVLNKKIVFFVFSLFLVAGGSIVLFYHPRLKSHGDSADNVRGVYTFTVLAGALIGLLSGFLGIGGGILVGPFLILRGFAAKDVSGTSSLFVAFSALTGFLWHLAFRGYAHVHIDYLLFVSVVVAALAGGAVGSHLARFKMSATQIRRVIGTLQYVMAVIILLQLKM